MLTNEVGAAKLLGLILDLVHNIREIFVRNRICLLRTTGAGHVLDSSRQQLRKRWSIRRRIHKQKKRTPCTSVFKLSDCKSETSNFPITLSISFNVLVTQYSAVSLCCRHATFLTVGYAFWTIGITVDNISSVDAEIP